jgi:hypothetical protein
MRDCGTRAIMSEYCEVFLLDDKWLDQYLVQHESDKIKASGNISRARCCSSSACDSAHFMKAATPLPDGESVSTTPER